MNIASPNKAFYLILITFAFAISLLFGLLTKMAPLTVSHTLYMCQKTVSDLAIFIPHSAPSVLALVGGLITTLGVIQFLLKLYSTQKFIRISHSNQIELPSKVVKIAKQLNILNRVEVVRSNSFTSYCYGFLKPRICISSHAVGKLTAKELKAVLIHESYHLKSKDPLKIFLSQIASSMFFFIPTLKDIKDYYIFSKEIAADQLVVKSNHAKSLRQALLKTINWQPQLMGVASFMSGHDYEQRILLLTSRQVANIRFSFIRLAISLMVFLTAFILVSLPVYAVEDSQDSHAYFICPFGNECAMSCKQEGIIREKPFSEEYNYTPIMYSSKHTP